MWVVMRYTTKISDSGYSTIKNGSVNWMYDEPDFGKYESLKK